MKRKYQKDQQHISNLQYRKSSLNKGYLNNEYELDNENSDQINHGEKIIAAKKKAKKAKYNQLAKTIDHSSNTKNLFISNFQDCDARDFMSNTLSISNKGYHHELLTINGEVKDWVINDLIQFSEKDIKRMRRYF